MKPKHGGARPGAGKPKSNNPESKSRTIRLTDEEYAKFKLIGGVMWLRKLLAEQNTDKQPDEVVIGKSGNY